MVECIANFSEQGFSYFCRVCASENKEPGRQFTSVYFRQSLFHCPGCNGTYFEGVKTPKFNSTNPSPKRFEVCGNTCQSLAELLRHSCGPFGQRSYRCPSCQNYFAVYSLLEDHMKRRDFVLEIICNNCSETFQGKICPEVYDKLIITNDLYCENCCNGSTLIEYVREF
ncbi:hypothetical protein TNIN_224251 [Trichonephila inaurata madagascariensis]|uniref:Zinc finger protein n=1 Tax=Trichonephila inaurata madagascariensis TaxID=2747483 RepID=A0A8X6M642_9ARAC|nr:hypothetical protein TNIN_224251 [Trichonephila inaurata madagascariensis]